MLKQIINIWKIMIKTESSNLEYLDVNNLYGWVVSEKRPVNGFKWVEELSQFKEDFIKNYSDLFFIAIIYQSS